MPIRELDNLPAYLAPLPYNQIIDTDSYKVPQWRFYRPACGASTASWNRAAASMPN
jgi:hypothetical protein